MTLIVKAAPSATCQDEVKGRHAEPTTEQLDVDRVLQRIATLHKFWGEVTCLSRQEQILNAHTSALHQACHAAKSAGGTRLHRPLWAGLAAPQSDPAPATVHGPDGMQRGRCHQSAGDAVRCCPRMGTGSTIS